MYTEEILRATLAYSVLVQSGCFAHGLCGNYQYPNEGWEIQFSILGKVDRESIKEIARIYLIDAYFATGIYFFQRTSDNDHQFRAHFHRGDI